MSVVCVLGVLIGGARPAIAMSPQPKAMSPRQADAGSASLADFLDAFWAEQFGVKFVVGVSGMVLDAVKDGDPLPDGEASLYWNLLVVDKSKPVDSIVVAKGLFIESFRIPLSGYEFSSEQLVMANLRSVSRFRVAGLVVSDLFGPRHIYGELIETILSDGQRSVALVPGGIADDAASAEAGAESFLAPPAETSPSGSARQGLVGRRVQVSMRDCAQEQQLCDDAARSRFRACCKNTLALTITCMAGSDATCALGCLASGPAYPVCLLACVSGLNAACLAAEALMLSGCQDELKAKLLDCKRERLQCDSQNRAAQVGVEAGDIFTGSR
jgi:hypothetical protein